MSDLFEIDTDSPTHLAVDWGNDNNTGFYTSLTPEQLTATADLAGLNGFNDLKTIWPLIERSESILDVGAGTGRALDFLRQHQYKGQVTAVERNPIFCNYMLRLYNDMATIVQSDIKQIQTNKQYDLILWLWSGISDFNPSEQKDIIPLLFKLVAPHGCLVIDTVPEDTPPRNKKTFSTGQPGSYQITHNDQHAIVHIPSTKAMEKILISISSKNYKAIDYLSSTNRPRQLYIAYK